MTSLPHYHCHSHRTRAYSDSTLGEGPGFHKFDSLNVASLQAHWELLAALGDRGVAVAALQDVRHAPHQLSDLDEHLHRHGWKAHRGPPLSPGTRVVPAQNGKHQYVTNGVNTEHGGVAIVTPTSEPMVPTDCLHPVQERLLATKRWKE
eukprot:7964074-Pyramimonas_sp.AAC.1